MESYRWLEEQGTSAPGNNENSQKRAQSLSPAFQEQQP
jgi:hypothetical protein